MNQSQPAEFIEIVEHADGTMRRSVTVTFTTNRESDEHLRSEQAIRDEVRSWLEGLGATVHTVTVKAADL